MRWLDWLRQPDDEDIPPDVRGVLEASRALKVSEFDLFRLAYRHWHGDEADEKALERIFVGYMFRQTVPLWVRQFCRQVLSAARAGALDRSAFGADRVAKREPLLYYRRGFIALTMVVLFLGYLVFRALRG